MKHDIYCPFPQAPEFGQAIAVADDILWSRMPLEGGLDHLNVYAVRDADGWAIIDAGMATEATVAHWETLLAGPLSGRAVTRIIVTHSHPDHVGAAGWLCRRCDAPLAMTFLEYMVCKGIAAHSGILEGREFASYYARHGLDPDVSSSIMARADRFKDVFARLPTQFVRLVDGETLTIGRRRFEIIGASGHSPEQALLYDRRGGILFAADQVMLKVTPNISVYAIEPDGDPLGLYLRSIAKLARSIDPNALVLPGHFMPFVGLAARAREIEEHHDDRCERIVAACRVAPQASAALVPVLFPHITQAFQQGFAFTEVRAHVNFLRALGRLVEVEGHDRVMRAHLADGTQSGWPPDLQPND